MYPTGSLNLFLRSNLFNQQTFFELFCFSSSRPTHPCDKQGCNNCFLDFYPLNLFVHRRSTLCMVNLESFHNEFMFFTSPARLVWW